MSLLRQLLIESALVTVAGLLAGALVAHFGIELLYRFGAAALPRAEEIALDGRVLLFSALTAALSMLVFGLWPAVRASRIDLIESLRGKIVGLVDARVIARLVVVEVAVAFVLLAAGLGLFRSLLASQAIDPGFRTENLVSIAIRVPQSKYPDVDARIEFHRRLREEVASVPGVLGATAGYRRPGGGWAGNSASLQFEGQTPDEATANPMASFTWAAPDYFEVAGIPLLAGRSFSVRDRLDSERVVIVSESIARTYWPGEEPVGKWVGHPRNERIRMRVVGVVGDTRYRELRRPWQSLYFAIDQNPFSVEPQRHPVSVPQELLVHTDVDPSRVLPSVLERIRSLDADVPLDDIASFEAIMDQELEAPRLHSFLSAVFALSSLLLAGLGIYGVVASFVAQRLPELGIRLALGATPAGLKSLVVSHALRLCAVGLGLGLGLALVSLRSAQRLMYGVSSTDAAGLAAVALVLGLSLLAASYIPARGASRADPLSLLRKE